MNNDPADERALERRRLGFHRELQQNRATLLNPGRGGARGYPTWYREQQIEKRHTGRETDVSDASISRWNERLDPYRVTGGKEREDLMGYDQFLMCLVLFAYPGAEADEIAAFVYTNGGGLYSRASVSKRMEDLEISN